MKANVDAAIPALTQMGYGYWGAIDCDQGEILAKWITQFSMSYEFADEKTVAVPAEERFTFSQTGKVSENWLVAIGYAEPKTNREPILHRRMAYIQAQTGQAKLLQSTSFLFGKLVCLAFYSEIGVPLAATRSMADAHLAVIHPWPAKGIRKPFWAHDENAVEFITDILTDALMASAGNLSKRDG